MFVVVATEAHMLPLPKRAMHMHGKCFDSNKTFHSGAHFQEFADSGSLGTVLVQTKTFHLHVNRP